MLDEKEFLSRPTASAPFQTALISPTPSGQQPESIIDHQPAESRSGCLAAFSSARGDDASRRVATELSRPDRLFLRDGHGERPIYGGNRLFQDDPYFRDHILFNEYFHGDNGAGLGAGHQTGWTGLVAKLIQQSGGWKDGS
jgi:hypothetical protein